MTSDSKSEGRFMKKDKSPLDRAFKVFSRGRKKDLPKNTFETLGFSRDPFEVDIEPSDTRHDTNISEIWEDGVLGSILGTILEKSSGAVVYGPSGIGKTLLAKTIAAFHEIGKLEEKTIYVDAAASYETLPTNLNSADLLLIDNPSPIWWSSPYLSEPEDNLENMPKIIAFLSYFDYKRLSDRAMKMNFKTFPFLGSTDYQKYPIPTFSSQSIVDILQTRLIESCTGQNHPFSEEALFEIAHYSMGLPILALQIARGVLSEFANTTPSTRSEKVTQTFVLDVVRNSPYAMSLSLVNSLKTAEVVVGEKKSDSRIKLTMGNTRRGILESMALLSVPVGKSRNGPSCVERTKLESVLLDAGLIKHSSSLSHHSQRLTETGFLQVQREANKVSYLLSSPVYHALELLSYPHK